MLGGIPLPDNCNLFRARMRRQSHCAHASKTPLPPASILDSLQAAAKAPKQIRHHHHAPSADRGGRNKLSLSHSKPIGPPQHVLGLLPCVTAHDDVNDDDPIIRPSLLPFEAMCARLRAWKARFGTAHVPRRCFDDAELGAWVRYMRRLRDRRALERWKADRLNLLSFEWEVSKEDAKWYASLHHLRHFKASYCDAGGERSRASPVTPLEIGLDGGLLRDLAAWVRQQAS